MTISDLLKSEKRPDLEQLEVQYGLQKLLELKMLAERYIRLYQECPRDENLQECVNAMILKSEIECYLSKRGN